QSPKPPLQNFPANINEPITIKATAAVRLTQSKGTYSPITPQTITPSAETAASARLAPMNTAQGFFVCAAIVIAASCVLSPISARKIIPNVVSRTRRSMVTPERVGSGLGYEPRALYSVVAVCD